MSPFAPFLPIYSPAVPEYDEGVWSYRRGRARRFSKIHFFLFTLVLGAGGAAVRPVFADKDPPKPADIYVGDRFKASILDIRPTQEAAGMEAVKEKVAEMEKLDPDELKKFLKKNPIPVVAGPDGKFYMIDHHHQSIAAHLAGRGHAYYVLETDYSKLKDMDEFWRRMKAKHWVREFDHLGNPLKIPDGLPKSILGMKDDPYRSLAYFVRKRGGYAKTSIEYAEFDWADFFREHVKPWHSREEFIAAVDEAAQLAHSATASHLPGWSKLPLKCKIWLEKMKDPA